MTHNLPWQHLDGGNLEALQQRLAQAAADRELIDVAYRTLDTSVGALLIARTQAGLVSVTFDGQDPEATLTRLAGELSPRILEHRATLDDDARRLEALIEGRAHSFDGDLDTQLAHGFRGQVVVALREIPFGERRSYGEIALAVGSPKAVRAVGTACAKNPLPIAIPCHRVVRSDGSIGQYAGGVEAKRQLLAMEAAKH